MTTESNGSGLPWKKINFAIGIVIGLGTIIGFVFGAQSYMENKYAENEDVRVVMEKVTAETEHLQQFIAMNEESIRLNQTMIRQKIVQDRIDRKKDTKLELKLKKTVTPQECDEKEKANVRLEQDIESLERDLKSIDKGL